MKFVLILRELTSLEQERVRSLSAYEEVRVIAVDDYLSGHEGVLPYQYLSDQEKKQINDTVFSRILEFGDLEVKGKPVSQQLNFSGAGLWYYHKFRIFFNVRSQQYKIAELAKNLYGASSATIFSSKKYTLEIPNVEFVLNKSKASPGLDLWSLMQYGLVVALRFLKSIFMATNSFNRKRFLCIDAVTQYRNVLNLDGKSVLYENVFLGYLYQKKADQLGLIDQLIIPKFSGKDKYRFDLNHVKNHNGRDRVLGERVLARAFLSLSAWRKMLAVKKELRLKYEWIDQSLNNDPLFRQFLVQFRGLETTTLYFLLKYFAYKNFFKSRRISSILSVDENSANFKIILDAAKQFGIHTIGYQHGNISKFSPNYMYTLRDLEQKPMPDLTVTWGEKWSRLLQHKGNYTTGAIGVAGQLRTDIIKSINENSTLDRRSILGEVRERSIVLFATQPQKDESLRQRAAEDAVLACKSLDSVRLIFKVHPREKDIELYQNVANKHGFKHFDVILDKELYLLLKVSDVVITCFSTVGTEALYFQKPLIILDHLKEDILGYHKEGVAFRATNNDELRHCIEGILKNELVPNAKVINEYLTQTAYRIDGKVSERLWEYLSIASEGTAPKTDA